MISMQSNDNNNQPPELTNKSDRFRRRINFIRSVLVLLGILILMLLVYPPFAGAYQSDHTQIQNQGDGNNSKILPKDENIYLDTNKVLVAYEVTSAYPICEYNGSIDEGGWTCYVVNSTYDLYYDNGEFETKNIQVLLIWLTMWERQPGCEPEVRYDHQEKCYIFFSSSDPSNCPDVEYPDPTEYAAYPYICVVPPEGSWEVTANCGIVKPVSAPGDVIVNKNIAVTIWNEGNLTIDFTKDALLIQPGGKIQILPGGSIN